MAFKLPDFRMPRFSLSDLKSVNLDSIKLWLSDLKANRKKQIILGGSALTFVAIVALGLSLVLGSGEEKERQKIIEVFETFSRARAMGAANDIVKLVSPAFNDAGMPYNAAVKRFSAKSPGYKATLINVDILENRAEVSYKRMERVGGKPVVRMILNETWRNEDGEWRLFRLSKVDRELIAKEATVQKDEVGVASAGEKPGAGAVTEPLEPAEEGEEIPGPAGEGEEKEGPVNGKEWVKQKEEVMEVLEARLSPIYAHYSPEGKRDPFKSLIVGFGEEAETQGPAGLKKCDPLRQREYLESFDLMSLNLVGIISGKVNVALIETPNGNGYTVKKGMHLGRKCGKIVRIRIDKVVVAEKVRHARKGFETLKREIKLRTEEE